MKSPIIIRRVKGNSMLPTLKQGQIIIGLRWLKPRVGGVVVFEHNGLEKIKRITSINNGTYYVLGDNSNESSDSREFGRLKNVPMWRVFSS